MNDRGLKKAAFWGKQIRLSSILRSRVSIPVLIVAAFVTVLFWAKTRDPFRRIEFSVKTASGMKVRGIAVLPRHVADSGRLMADGHRNLPSVIYLHGSGGNLLTDGKDLRLIAEQGVAAVGLEYNQSNQAAFDEEFIALLRYLKKQSWAAGRSSGQGGEWKVEDGKGPPEFALSSIHHPLSSFQTAWVGFSLGAQRQLSFLLRHPEYAPDALVRISGGLVDEVEKLKIPNSKPATSNLKSRFLLIHGENDEVFPVDDCRRLGDSLKANGAVVETRIFLGQNHSFGADRPTLMRGVGEYCAILLGHGHEIQILKPERIIRPVRLNTRSLFLYYWLPFVILTLVILVGQYFRWHKSVAEIPRGKLGTVLLCLAWILGIAAFLDTAFHVGLPRLTATEFRLNLAGKWLVQPKLNDDFVWLRNHLQKVTKDLDRRAWSDASCFENTGQSVGCLLEHVELADYNRGLVNWQVPDDVYREFVLSPIIERGETGASLSTIYHQPSADLKWRRPLWENFYPGIRKESDPLAAAQIVVRFLRERVTIVPGEVPFLGIRSIWEMELTDATGFEQIYVAALRSAGIPARLNGDGRAEVFEDGKWSSAPRPLITSFLSTFNSQ